MRKLVVGALFVVVACGGGSDDGIGPRLIPGGGVGDGDIDGNVYVHVIDAATDEPLVGAIVAIGKQTRVTDETGLVEVGDVDGAQTIAIRAQGHRDTVWAYVNGTNVTVPLASVEPGPVRGATVSGTISGWDPNAPSPRRAVIFAPTADAGLDVIFTALPGCNTPALVCNWGLDLPPGETLLLAAIIEEQGISTTIGWASATIVVEDGVDQTGITLAPIPAGSLDTVAVDFGSLPRPLDLPQAFLGIELAADRIIQVPFESDKTMLVPRPSVLGANVTFRLTASATAMGTSSKNTVLRRGLTGPTLAAGAWLPQIIGATASRTRASWQSVPGATLYQVRYDELDIMVFDASALSVDVPSSVAITSTGPAGTEVRAIGADIDPKHFSFRDVDVFASAGDFLVY